MGKILAYIQALDDKQDVNNQRHEILEAPRLKDMKIGDFISMTMTSRKTSKQRRIKEVLHLLERGDTLIVTELSRLGRNTVEIIALVHELVQRGIRLIALKQNIDLNDGQHDMSSKIIVTVFSLLAELERDFISLRTKEALSVKKSQGITLGKPKGTIRKSKFDADLPRIKELLALGLSVRKIAKHLGYVNHYSLNIYISKWKLHEQY
ncbi:recombinase family protein [Dictyobacter formicarum]|uniref:Resolvase n=1 Tax=Dictyobacter formicarum TaxID=2778368 RepID=A0ABQ3VSY6_9CHLR|nr:recombinase family protein [Dictyobacter formicarum]GHO89397.1 resolvase [Dictyobacter formicarum]